jgi:superfamily II DNA or RNA helicase
LVGIVELYIFALQNKTNMKNLETELRNILKSRNLDLRENFTRNIIDIIEPPLPHVVAAAVSSGKTYLTAAKFELYYKCGLIKKDEKVLILASSLTILRDNFIEQFEQFKIDSFTYKSIENKSDLQQAIKDNIQVLITIPQTIDKHLKLIKNVKWMVVDEAHKWYFASTIRRIKQQLKPKYTLLLTGTPFKFNARKSEFIIDYTSVKDLYDKGYIDDVQLKVLHSSVELAQMDYASILGHLKQSKRLDTNELTKSLDIVIKQLIKILKLKNKRWDSVNNISKNYISLFTKMEKSIIFTNGITECDCIYECLKLNKVNCLKSHSEDDQDAVYTFQQFKKDDSIKVLVVVNRGKEGFNFPELYNIIDFSYTQDFATSMQMIGRLLRKSQGKIDKVFYKVAPKNTSLYFMDWMNYLIQLFDNEWYEKYNGRNARQIRVPNNLLNGRTNSNERTTQRNRRRQFNPINLDNTGMRSLSFMNENKWFKSKDILSVVGSTTLEDIFKRYGIYKRNEYVSWDECLKYAQSLKLTGANQWRQNDKPNNIPLKPYDIYKDEWNGWGNFLGTGTIATYNIKYRKVEDAIKFVHKLKFKTREEWSKYCKSGKKPNDIPNSFRNVYNISTGEWLGTNVVATNDRIYLSYDKAKSIVSKMGFKNNKEFRKAHKEGKIQSDIPSTADSSYNKKGTWGGWKDFLGK